MNVERTHARIRASQRQKLLNQLRRTVGFQRNMLKCVSVFRFVSRPSQGQLRFGVNESDGSAQLVRCIGGEPRDLEIHIRLFRPLVSKPQRD